MNNISQISIFDYTEIENLGDLEKLKLFLENVEDEELCEILEKERKNGRNDYPVRAMLNSIYAMKIYEHRGIESLRRELKRNSQLRTLCGFNEGEYKFLKKRKHLVPPARVYTGFIKSLKRHKEKIKKINERLNGRLDRDYMFNDHFIRGQEKMELMVDLSFLVMLTMAKGHIKNKQKNIRSLVA